LCHWKIQLGVFEMAATATRLCKDSEFTLMDPALTRSLRKTKEHSARLRRESVALQEQAKMLCELSRLLLRQIRPEIIAIPMLALLPLGMY
jgi:hypothetical protein